MRTAEKSPMTPLLCRGVDPAPRWARIDFVLCAGLVLVGLALRLPGLNQGLWIDEIWTLVAYVRLPAAEIVSHFSLNNHILYSLSAHFSVAWFGESPWSLRLPSLLFGVAAIPATYYLGLQIAPRREAFLAVFFMALNYQFVWFSQNARGYMGLLLGSVIASILFIRLVATARPPARVIVAYAAVVALTMWIHLSAVVVILVHATIWLALYLRATKAVGAGAATPSRTALLLSVLLALALYTPVFQDVLMQVNVGDVLHAPAEALPVIGETRFISNPMFMLWLLEEFSRGLKNFMPGGWLLMCMAIAALLFGAASYLKQGIAVAGLMLLPTLTTAALASGFAQFFYPRFFFSSLAFLMLVAVRGGFRLTAVLLPILSSRQVLAIGILLALGSASLLPGAWKPKQDFKAASEFIAQHRLAGDGVACVGVTYLAMAGYLGMDCATVGSESDLERIENQHERVWLIHTLPWITAAEMPGVWERIQTRSKYQPVKTFEGSLGGGDIAVMQRR